MNWLPQNSWNKSHNVKCVVSIKSIKFRSRSSHYPYATFSTSLHVHSPFSPVCSGSVVVTAYDLESRRPGWSPEWGLIYYKASITAQGIPEPSSLQDSTLGTRAAEHKGCNWGMQIDWWLQSFVRPHLQWHHLAYATGIMSIQLHDSIVMALP